MQIMEAWSGFGVGSVLDRSGLGLGSVFGIGLGSFWARFGFGLESVCGRFGIGLGSVWGIASAWMKLARQHGRSQEVMVGKGAAVRILFEL
jgi:hypothetical protein